MHGWGPNRKRIQYHVFVRQRSDELLVELKVGEESFPWVPRNCPFYCGGQFLFFCKEWQNTNMGSIHSFTIFRLAFAEEAGDIYFVGDRRTGYARKSERRTGGEGSSLVPTA